MLFLGNIKFGNGDNAKIDALGATDPLRVAESLLGVEDMSKLLVTAADHGQRRDDRRRPQPGAGRAARDALVKIMYARLFATSSSASTRRSTIRRGVQRTSGCSTCTASSSSRSTRSSSSASTLPTRSCSSSSCRRSSRARRSSTRRRACRGRPSPTPTTRTSSTSARTAPTASTSCSTRSAARPTRAARRSARAAQGARQAAGLRRAQARARRRSAPRTTTSSSSTLRATSSTLRGEFLDKNNDSLDGEVEAHLLKSSQAARGRPCATPEAAADRRAARRRASLVRLGRRQVRQVAQGADDGAAAVQRALRALHQVQPRAQARQDPRRVGHRRSCA